MAKNLYGASVKYLNQEYLATRRDNMADMLDACQKLLDVMGDEKYGTWINSFPDNANYDVIKEAAENELADLTSCTCSPINIIVCPACQRKLQVEVIVF